MSNDQVATPGRVEFPYLDGLRGASAMIVVLFHAFLYTGRVGEADAAMPYWGMVIGFGYIGVAVFIVLSGYVLMLPVTTSVHRTLSGGTWAFIKRRARRILPPYYASLLFALALIWMLPIMQEPAGTAWDSKLPVTWQALASHMVLLHDLSPEWIIKINGPLWSVAVEWQIYFVMALLLIPLWRRFKPGAIVTIVMVLTLVPAFMGTAAFAHPWFLGLFAAGMWAAQLTLASEEPRGVGLAAIVFALLTPAAAVAGRLTDIYPLALTETAAGLAVAAALVWVGRRELAGKRNPLARPFRSRPMLFLGLFSYSIYLFHSPVLGLVNLIALPLELPVMLQYLVLNLIGIPAAIAVAWAMFLLVERRFLNNRQQHARVELSTAGSAPQSVEATDRDG